MKKLQLILSAALVFVIVFGCKNGKTAHSEDSWTYKECLHIDSLLTEYKKDRPKEYISNDDDSSVIVWKEIKELCRQGKTSEVIDYYDNPAHKGSLSIYFRCGPVRYEFVKYLYLPLCQQNLPKQEYIDKGIKELEFQEYLTEASIEMGKMQGRDYHPEHQEDLLFNLYSFYMDGGKFDLAIQLAEKMITTETELYGPDNPNVANSIYNKAWAYRKAGKNDLSIVTMKQAIIKYQSCLDSCADETVASQIKTALENAQADLAEFSNVKQ